jgi:hypothetical protein
MYCVSQATSYSADKQLFIEMKSNVFMNFKKLDIGQYIL